MSKRIGILGCGWLGTAVAQHFIENNHTVVGSTRTPESAEKLQKKGIDSIVFDIETDKLPEKLLSSDILLIAVPPTKIGATQLDKERALGRWKDFRGKILYCSSIGVYPPNGGPFSEREAVYQKSKHSQTDLFTLEKMFASNPRCTIVRLGGMYGPNRTLAGIYGRMAVVRNANQPVNFIHQADVVGIIATIIEKEKWGKIYNAVGPNPLLREELVVNLKAAGKPVTEKTEKSLSAGRKVSVDKVQTELDYNFAFPMLDYSL